MKKEQFKLPTKVVDFGLCLCGILPMIMHMFIFWEKVAVKVDRFGAHD
jgi:hypothetical protein